MVEQQGVVDQTEVASDLQIYITLEADLFFSKAFYKP
jgi:hypothetical protein